MEIHIQEIRWAQNRVTGKRTETVIHDAAFPCVCGEIEALRTARKTFIIGKVTHDAVTVTIRNLTHPDADQSLTLAVGDSRTYAPRSFGAGYIYRFSVK